MSEKLSPPRDSVDQQHKLEVIICCTTLLVSRSGGILAHSSLLHCSSSLRFVDMLCCPATAFQLVWTVSRRFAAVLWVIVLLHSSRYAKLQLSDRLPHV